MATLIEPMTPADLDLRDFAYMPLDVVRLRDSDQAVLATGEGFRAAVLLWCAAWHQVPASSLPSDERLLANLAGFGRDLAGWRAVSEEALRGFVECSDGRLYHPVIAEKAIEAGDKRRAQMTRTSAATKARGKVRMYRDVDRDDEAEAASNSQRDDVRHVERDVDRDDARNDHQGNRIEEKGKDSSESTALEGRARDSKQSESAVAIRREIISILNGGRQPGDGPPGELPPGDIHRVDLWIAQGYPPALIRAVVVERIRAGKRPASMAWFDPALAEAAKVKAPLQVVATLPPATDDDWRLRMRKFKSDGLWIIAWGPRPDCLANDVPPHILDEFKRKDVA